MVNNEKYIKLLKSMISCVSHGDYSSIKELSNLELKQMEQKEKNISKEIKKVKRFTKLNKYKNIPLEKWDSKELTNLLDIYSKYMLNKIEKTQDLEQLQSEAISIYEFIEKI